LLCLHRSNEEESEESDEAEFVRQDEEFGNVAEGSVIAIHIEKVKNKKLAGGQVLKNFIIIKAHTGLILRCFHLHWQIISLIPHLCTSPVYSYGNLTFWRARLAIHLSVQNVQENLLVKAIVTNLLHVNFATCMNNYYKSHYNYLS
jgi:hypothetical protein